MLSPTEYLEDQKIPEQIAVRVRTVMDFYQKLLGSEPTTGIFLGETRDNEGQILYQSLWLFTDRYICEAHNFLTTEMFDLAVLDDHFVYFSVSKFDFQPGQATGASRLALNYRTMFRLSGTLQASGSNCEHLWTVLQEIVLPNVSAGVLPPRG